LPRDGRLWRSAKGAIGSYLKENEGSVFMAALARGEESESFLKKRTKKLLLL
jgi:hypothetical protein